MKSIEGSFRDPDGYVFEHNSEIFRAVNYSYKSSYDHLMSSGLYKTLVDKSFIVKFGEVDPSYFGKKGLYKVLKPEQIPFVSYPYEWSFNMLKDAALLTLDIQKLALEYGMSLKDASAFNIQFRDGKPILIDSLSFELYPLNHPWVAYRQFCQHFITSLSLMAYVDPRLNRMFIIHIDGIPLELAVKALPFRSRFHLGLYLHIFLHAKAQKKFENSNINFKNRKQIFPLKSMNILVEGLRSTIENLHWKSKGTEWANYTNKGVHLDEYKEFKTNLISAWLDDIKPNIVWDLGANDGIYSRIAALKGSQVISADMDPVCVEKNYSYIKRDRSLKIFPILLDLSNSSPAIGWGGAERLSLSSRSKPDLILALAIIHHLTISSNIPLESIASYFSQNADSLIIEFVTKEDEKIKLMLINRKDIFHHYTQIHFEEVFSQYYKIEQRISSNYNHRIFYLMTKKKGNIIE